MIIPQYHPSLYHSDIISWGAFCKVSFAVCSWTFKYAPQPPSSQGVKRNLRIFFFKWNSSLSCSELVYPNWLIVVWSWWVGTRNQWWNKQLLESSSPLLPNVRFQKRARWGIGLVTRREGLYRSENKQLKTFCWLHVFLWMITTCLKRCSQHQLLLWIYATPWLLYMILSAPYLALQLTLLKKGYFFKTISWPFPRCIFWFSAIIGEIAGLLSQSLLKWDRGILEQPTMGKTSGNLISIAHFGQDSQCPHFHSNVRRSILINLISLQDLYHISLVRDKNPWHKDTKTYVGSIFADFSNHNFFTTSPKHFRLIAIFG